MPRRPRVAMGGLAYHVINRGVGRMTLFEDDADYAAFERVLAAAVERRPGSRLLGYCVMPRNWRSSPYGSRRTAERLGLDSTLRPCGRPRVRPEKPTK